MSDEGNKKFLEALKQEFLKAAKDTSPLMFPVLPAPGKSGVEFQNHLRWMEEKARAMYGVPASMLTPAGAESGRAAALAEQYQIQQIQGRKADWVCIDEAPVHPNCRCEPVPVSSSSLNVGNPRDDMLDALAISCGLRRKHGEDDADFRSRVRAMSNLAKPEQAKWTHAALSVDGVEQAIVSELEPGLIGMHVAFESVPDIEQLKADVMAAVEAARPAGVKVEYYWSEVDPPEEDALIRRLRSKILERYPNGE